MALFGVAEGTESLTQIDVEVPITRLGRGYVPDSEMRFTAIPGRGVVLVLGTDQIVTVDRGARVDARVLDLVRQRERRPP